MEKLVKQLKFLRQVLIYGYIWQIPYSWRLIIDPSRSLINDSFNEYMDISLYLGEVLLTFALVLHILEYIIKEKSILRKVNRCLWKNFFHVERLAIVIVILLVCNLALSTDLVLSFVTLFHWLILVYFLYQIRDLYVSRGTNFIESVFYILFFSIIIQFSIALFQVINGSSVGLNFLNESILSVDGINVAKSNISSIVVLRGYGTFPHPNILSVYAVYLILFITVFLKKLFHVKQSLIHLAVAISFSTIILTQSKLSIIFILMYGIYFIIKKYQLNKLFHVEYFVFLFIILALMYPTFKIDINNSFKTRIEQYKFQEVNNSVSLFGSGLGTYRISYDSADNQWWIYEPIHFVPIILVKELGLLLVVSILVGLLMKYKNVPRETLKESFLPIVFFVYILSVDHYVWDIYQGMFLGIITIALLIYIDKYNNLYLNID